MSQRLIAACIQTNAGPDIEGNLKAIEPLIREAHKKGAHFITLPENVTSLLGPTATERQRKSEAEHPAIPFFRKMAQETGAWILAGSLSIALPDEKQHDKLANRSYLFDAKGNVVARYDKIHMFDANVSAQETPRESHIYRGGNQAVCAVAPWGKIGLAICYDVRFPHLFRALAKAGASIITVPAAFTVPTGKLHWHVLLRARAIETGAYIVAPAQCGTHDGGRKTYGHSLIIDPLGRILAEAGDEPAVITAELDMKQVEEARHMLPSLTHDREFACP